MQHMNDAKSKTHKHKERNATKKCCNHKKNAAINKQNAAPLTKNKI